METFFRDRDERFVVGSSQTEINNTSKREMKYFGIIIMFCSVHI